MNFLHPASLHAEPCCFQGFIYQQQGIEGEGNEAAVSAAEVRPRRDSERTHPHTQETQREGKSVFY